MFQTRRQLLSATILVEAERGTFPNSLICASEFFQILLSRRGTRMRRREEEEVEWGERGRREGDGGYWKMKVIKRGRRLKGGGRDDGEEERWRYMWREYKDGGERAGRIDRRLRGNTHYDKTNVTTQNREFECTSWPVFECTLRPVFLPPGGISCLAYIVFFYPFICLLSTFSPLCDHLSYFTSATSVVSSLSYITVGK